MNLYFQNSKNEKKLLGTPSNMSEVSKTIRDFCEERGFKPCYMRAWNRENEIVFDVGSHTEFFILDHLLT